MPLAVSNPREEPTMTSEDIRGMMRTRPFRPFRLILSNGRSST